MFKFKTPFHTIIQNSFEQKVNTKLKNYYFTCVRIWITCALFLTKLFTAYLIPDAYSFLKVNAENKYNFSYMIENMYVFDFHAVMNKFTWMWILYSHTHTVLDSIKLLSFLAGFRRSIYILARLHNKTMIYLDFHHINEVHYIIHISSLTNNWEEIKL